MKLLLSLLILVSSFVLSGCSQDERTARLESRQDGIDRRSDARLERRQIRSDHADARAQARFDSW